MISPDDKDWTWTLRRPCPQCGFAAADLAPTAVADRLRAEIDRWPAVLARTEVAVRPSPQTWSALEYGCHVRDCCEVFAGRVRLMLDHDDPVVENWDQDRTAVDKNYLAADPATVSAELVARGAEVAYAFAGVRDGQWQRTGRRSNGSVFTVATLGQYFAHDIVHHGWDVSA